MRVMGPTTRSEWVKDLQDKNILRENKNMTKGFVPEYCRQDFINENHPVFKIVQMKEEPAKGNGTRSTFETIISTWPSHLLTHDASSQKIPTIGTHKPDVLHRAKGKTGEQSIVVVGEIKPMPTSALRVDQFGEFSDAEVGQILDFLLSCLRVQPWRTFVYGYLTDCRRFQFFKATKMLTGLFRFENSEIYCDVLGYTMLHLFLSQPYDRLGFQDVSLRGWTVDAYLGGGETSAVVTAKRTADGTLAVCKIYLDEEQGEKLQTRENDALRKMHSPHPNPHVAVAYQPAPKKTVSGKFVLIKTPIGCELRTDIRLSIAAYAPIVDVLRDAHSKDLFHNDVAPENMFAVKQPTGEYIVILNDFGSAASKDEIQDAHDIGEAIGTRELYYSAGSGAVWFGAAADLGALARSVFYLTQATFDTKTVTTAQGLDAIMKAQLPMWGAALRMAAAVDYNALRDLFTSGIVPAG